MDFKEGNIAKVPTSLFQSKRSETRGKDTLKNRAKAKTHAPKNLARYHHAENIKKRSRKKNQSRERRGSRITLDQMHELREAFVEADADGGGSLDEEEFVGCFSKVLEQTGHLEHLFMKIDANADGDVTWDEFTNFMLLEDQGALNMKSEASAFELRPAKAVKGQEMVNDYHKEMVSRIIMIFEPGPLYLTCSSEGKIKFWNMKDLTCYGVLHHCSMDVEAHPFQPLTPLAKMRENRKAGAKVDVDWSNPPVTQKIVDAAYLPLSQALAVSSIDQRITFYSMTHPIHVLGYTDAFPGTPLCMSAVDTKSEERFLANELFVVGDDEGNIYVYHLKDDWTLNDVIQSHFIIETREGFPSMAKYIYDEYGDLELFGANERRTESPFNMCFMSSCHTKWVTKVEYISELDWILSASLDGRICFIDIDDGSVKKSRTFKGHGRSAVYDFTWCSSLKLVASCGMGRSILLWDPFTKIIVQRLYGHTDAVHKMVLSSSGEQLLSLGSTSKTIKLWDLRQSRCIQTVQDRSVYRPSNRISTMLFHGAIKGSGIPARLVTASNHLNLWNVKTKKTDKRIRSHAEVVVGALYNNKFNQVVSADQSSVVHVWEIDTGELAYRFSNAHEGAHITTFCFDGNYRRMISGADDGTIKVFNFSNGQCIRRLHSNSERGSNEISALAYLEGGKSLLTRAKDFGVNNKYIISCGWDRRVHVYLDGDDDDSIDVNYSQCIPKLDWERQKQLQQIDAADLGKQKHVLTRRQIRSMNFNVPHKPKEPNGGAGLGVGGGMDRFGEGLGPGQNGSGTNKAAPTVVSGAAARSNRAGRRLRAAKIPFPTTGHSGDILCMAVCDKHTIATGGADGYVCLWELEGGQLRSKTQVRTKAPETHMSGRRGSAPTAEAKEVMALVYLHRLHVLVTSCSEGTLVMWTVRGFEMRQRRVIVPEYLPEQYFSSIGTDGTRCAYLLAGDTTGNVAVWSLARMGSHVMRRTREVKGARHIYHDKSGSFRMSVNSVADHTDTPAAFTTESLRSKVLDDGKKNSSSDLIRIGYWKAHKGVVRSIEFVSPSSRGEEVFNEVITADAARDFLPEGAILTSSSDLCVVLWKIDGTKIGIFGQRKKWKLDDPFTWASQMPAEMLDWDMQIKSAKYARNKLKSHLKMRWCNVSGPIVVGDSGDEASGSSGKQRLSTIATDGVVVEDDARNGCGQDDACSEKKTTKETNNTVTNATRNSSKQRRITPSASSKADRESADVGVRVGELEATDAEVKAAALYRSLALRDGREETPEVVEANIWVRLPCHSLQGIPQSHRSFMHRSTREKEIRRKKKRRPRLGKSAI